MLKHSQIKLLLLSFALLLGGVSVWGEDVTLATATFDGKNGKYTEGWTTTGTGNGRNDCVIIGSGENITSPAFDFSAYSKITISIKARRYGTLTDSKATISVAWEGGQLGTVDASSTSATTALTNVSFDPTASMTAAKLVFTCTNATSAGSSHGAGINSIVIKGTPKAGPVNLTTFAFANTTPAVTMSKKGGTYEAEYTQTVTVEPAAYDGTVTYAIDESNSTFDTDDVIIDDETGEVLISTSSNVGGTIAVKASGSATSSYNAPADATYTLTVNAAPVGVGTPTFSLEAGDYYYGTTVAIEAVNATLITYTTDGSDPTMESATYSAPVAITKSMTLKAKAWDDDMNESAVASVTYALKAPQAPAFSVEGGEVLQGTTVTLTPGEGGSVVVYTTDGSDPTTDSDIYDSPIAITADMTIKAATVDDGDNLSAVASFDFTVKQAVVYDKVTDASTLSVGDKLIIVYETDKYAMGTISGSVHSAIGVTVADGKVTDPAETVAVLTLGGEEGAWTLRSNLTNNYLNEAGYSNELKESTTATDSGQKWAISISGGNAKIVNNAYGAKSASDNTSRYIQYNYNSGTPRFAAYAGTQKDVQLYRLHENLADATITIAPAEDFELNIGETKVLTVTTTSDGDITAASSDEAVATVAKTGSDKYTVTAVSGTVEGATATISFSTVKTAAHKAAVASVVVTVKDSRQTLDLSFAETSVDVNIGETVDAPVLSGNAGGGAVSYASSNETVATVDASTGKVTGVAEGTATITATVAEVTGYKGGTATFTVNVIDPNRKGTLINPYTVAEAIDAIDNGGDVTGVYAKGIVSEIVTAYSSQYGNITYNISADGKTTGDQLQAYRGVGKNGQRFTSANDIQVGDEVVIYGNLKKFNSTYEFDSGNQLVSLTREQKEAVIVVQDETVAFGETFTVDDTMIEGGPVTVSSSNTSVATVDGLVITPQAVGTTTITVATAESEFYKAGSETFTLTVTAPAGGNAAPVSGETIILNETFDKSTGTAGWSGNAASGTAAYDNTGWTGDKVSGNGGSIKMGTTNAKGYATTPALGQAGDFVLTFKSGAWAGDKTEGGLVLSVAEGSGTLGTTTFDLKDSAWDTYETTITGATADTKITFSAAQASKNRFFLDDVKVTATIAAPVITTTLNADGYATYCSQYPLDFTDAEGYTAWQITDVDDDAVTFTKITGAVKGGEGILLKGQAGSVVELKSADSNSSLGSNMLEGIMVPTYVGADQYYGLSGDTFVRIGAGVVPAGKALLPAAYIPSTARRLAFAFQDDDQTTGVGEELMMNSGALGTVYDLQGRKVSHPKAGLYIVNGRKVVVR